MSEVFDFRDKKILFIINPTACHGQAKTIIPELREYLGRQGISYDISETQGPRHAIELARKASSHYDVIISVGGDGTAHEVANGILEATLGPASAYRKESLNLQETICLQQDAKSKDSILERIKKGKDNIHAAATSFKSPLHDKRPVFGIIPFGSGNDFSRTIGMYGDESTRMQRLLSCSEVPYDAGICNGEYYIETFSIGLDANIANRTIYLRQKGSKLKDTPLYARAAVDVFKDFYEPMNLTIEIDGVQRTKERLIFACQLGPTYGGGFPIALDADISDGLFDTISAPFISRKHSIPIFIKVMQGKHGDRTDIFDFIKGQSVVVQADRVLTGQLDGEPWSYDKFELQIVPNALRVLAHMDSSHS